jgi:hypothetical protein
MAAPIEMFPETAEEKAARIRTRLSLNVEQAQTAIDKASEKLHLAEETCEAEEELLRAFDEVMTQKGAEVALRGVDSHV